MKSSNPASPVSEHSGAEPDQGTSVSQPRITIFTRSYPPAYLHGGPARSLFALVEALADEFAFSVVTSSVDDLATGPMESIEPDRWSTHGQAAIWYELRYRGARRTAVLLRATRPHTVYLNSLFDYRFAILPLLVSRLLLRNIPIVLAPRGELSIGALALKRHKKRVFIAAFRLLGLHRAVIWHASTDQERADIVRVFGPDVRSHIAIDLRANLCLGEEIEPDRKGDCSVVFFSRIVPKKNLATAIQALPLVKGDVRLSIAGPIEDRKYWAQCQQLTADSHSQDLVSYIGVVPAPEAVSFLGRFDLFVLPTFGENFGHVVLEALTAGTPVIIGRDTPWRQIEVAGAGWVCDPASHEHVAELIQRFVDLDDVSRQCMRAAARGIATEILNDPKSEAANRAMFLAVSSGGTA